MLLSEFRTFVRKRCPVCGTSEIAFVRKLYDDRFGQPEIFDVFECQNTACRLAFLKKPIAPEELSRLYAKYYHHHSARKLSNTSERLLDFIKKIRDKLFNTENFYRRIKSGQRVLDIGCGYGPSISFLKNKSITWTGLEVDPVKAANNCHKGLDCRPLSLEAFVSTEPGKYDAVIINQVIEHISDPVHFFTELRKVLFSHSIVYISTPNYASKYRQWKGKQWVHWHVPYHQIYFSPKSIRYLSEACGFKIVELYSRTPFPFYALQRNFKPVRRGRKNPTFHEKISPQHFRFFIDLGNYTSWRREDEDCLYAWLRPNGL